MRRFLIILVLLGAASGLFAQSGLIKGDKDYYLANTVVLKLKQSPASDAAGNVTLPSEVRKAAAFQGMKSAVQKFPDGKNALYKSSSGLDKIVTVTYTSGEDPLSFSKKISRMGEVEWAEPRYVRIAAYDVNDPQFTALTQYNLFNIKAKEAWDINRGDKKIIIGIIDSGVFWDHPDLVANIHQNLGEDANHNGHTIEWDGTKWIFDPGDLNGVDDDGNGFTDDLVGWDFGGNNGTPDNNPAEDSPFHGTFVAGVASAVTNNNIGIASIGFNCSLMPVKCTRNDLDSRYVIYALEGIKYAVDNGAQIINCSFAGYSYSNAEQEIINYAISKGALVIAAAGNDNTSLPNYPAGYDGVLSAAASNISDKMWASSNYGETIDVVAPGQQIYSTWGTNGYMAANGTSFAAPITAGLAGLVKNQFPSYTPLQIAEQIRATCDDIYSLNADSLKYKLGKGRINAYRALTETNAVSVRAKDIVFKDEGNGNGVIESGEMSSIQINFVNYLSPVSGVNVNITTSSPYVSIENGSFNLGALSTLGTASNSGNKFYFHVKSNAPQNERVLFLLNYSGGNYTDFQWISVVVNPSYGTMSGNNISLSVSNAGNLGFADFPDNLQGTGFKYLNGENILYEGSFLYGTSASKLLDAARINDGTKNRDFKTLTPFIKKSTSQYADAEGRASFNDSYAAQSLGIETKILSYQYSAAPYNNFIIIRTVLSNKTSSDITNFYTGWFLDLDLDDTDYSDDMVAYNQAGQFIYAYDSNFNPFKYYVGAALLTAQPLGVFAIDNAADNLGLAISPSFTKQTKWSMLSGGIGKTTAGPSDISFMISAGPMTIRANSFQNVAYVLAVGQSVDDLKTIIAGSRLKYSLIPDDAAVEQTEIPAQYSLSQNYPNPFNSFTKINFDLPKEDFVKIRVFDAIGREIALLANGTIPAGKHFALFNGNSFPSGVYYYQIETSSFHSAKKMVLIK